MAAQPTLDRRVDKLEERVDEVEHTLTAHGKTLYTLSRRTAKLDLGLARVMDHLGVPQVTEDEVDRLLDEE